MKKLSLNKSIGAFLVLILIMGTFLFKAQEVSAIAPDPLDNATVIITNYGIEGADNILPGEKFTLNITLQNSSYTEYVGNVYVKFSQDDGYIYPDYGNTALAYAGYFVTQEEKTVSMQLVAADYINVSEILAKLTVCYSDAYSTKNEIENTIHIPVSNNGVLVVKGYDVASDAIVNKTNRLGVTYYNSGSTDINSIVMHMSGGTLESQDISFGSLSSGSIETADAYFTFTGEGAQAVDLYFTYIDSDGITHQTTTQTVTFNVSAEDENATSESTYNSNLYKANIMISLILLAGSLFIAFVLFIIIRKSSNN